MTGIAKNGRSCRDFMPRRGAWQAEMPSASWRTFRRSCRPNIRSSVWVESVAIADRNHHSGSGAIRLASEATSANVGGDAERETPALFSELFPDPTDALCDVAGKAAVDVTF